MMRIVHIRAYIWIQLVSHLLIETSSTVLAVDHNVSHAIFFQPIFGFPDEDSAVTAFLFLSKEELQMTKDERINYEREMEAYYMYKTFVNRDLYGDEMAEELRIADYRYDYRKGISGTCLAVGHRLG